MLSSPALPQVYGSAVRHQTASSPVKRSMDGKRLLSPTSASLAQTPKRARLDLQHRDCLHCGDPSHRWTACFGVCLHCGGRHLGKRCSALGIESYTPGGLRLNKHFRLPSGEMSAFEWTPLDGAVPGWTTAGVGCRASTASAWLPYGEAQAEVDEETVRRRASSNPSEAGISPLDNNMSAGLHMAGENVPAAMEETSRKDLAGCAARAAILDSTETLSSAPPMDFGSVPSVFTPGDSADEERRLFVANLAYTVTEDDVRHLFKDFLIESVTLPFNLRTTRPCGYAFVDLSIPFAAEHAVRELDGKMMLARKVSVQIARKIPPTTARPGTNAAGYVSTPESASSQRYDPCTGPRTKFEGPAMLKEAEVETSQPVSSGPVSHDASLVENGKMSADRAALIANTSNFHFETPSTASHDPARGPKSSGMNKIPLGKKKAARSQRRRKPATANAIEEVSGRGLGNGVSLHDTVSGYGPLGVKTRSMFSTTPSTNAADATNNFSSGVTNDQHTIASSTATIDSGNPAKTDQHVWDVLEKQVRQAVGSTARLNKPFNGVKKNGSIHSTTSQKVDQALDILKPIILGSHQGPSHVNSEPVEGHVATTPGSVGYATPQYFAQPALPQGFMVWNWALGAWQRVSQWYVKMLHVIFNDSADTQRA